MALITTPKRPAPSPWNLVCAATLAIGVAAVCYELPTLLPRLYRLHRAIPSNDLDTMPTRVYEMTGFVINIGVGIIAPLLYPSLTSLCARLRGSWNRIFTALSLIAACAFLSSFIIHYGNRQFGLYDFGILIDTGWRQIIGQRPYVDFFTSTPPGFNLGIKYAFELFGTSWDAQLYFTALFASISFLWLYWLLHQLTERRIVAFWAALAAECAITLELCFWWYNDETEAIALLFFLSCLLLSRKSNNKLAQFSYYLSLALLALMKPNIAATLGLCGIALTLTITHRKLHVLLLTCASAVTTAVILFANHISIPAMLGAYHAAAAEHGLTLFGLRGYDEPRKVTALILWALALAFPIGLLIPAARRLRIESCGRFAYMAFFPAMFVITAYGMTTNSDMEDLLLAGIFISGIVILFGTEFSAVFSRRPLLRRIYAALLFAMLASDLYAGALRWRVHGIGPGQFFEWNDTASEVNSSFFGDLRASHPMTAATSQIQAAIHANQGPIFLGPRLESYYAADRIPSPDHLPIVWEPGTFFARADEGKLIANWQTHNFTTLVFLKDDYTYYTPQFLSVINSSYTKDSRFSELTVYHHKASQ